MPTAWMNAAVLEAEGSPNERQGRKEGAQIEAAVPGCKPNNGNVLRPESRELFTSKSLMINAMGSSGQ